MKGLYLHIPFCKSKCPYCDFYSAIPKGDAISGYCDAIKDEIESGSRTSFFVNNESLRFDTVYFGGGTPSVIGGNNIASLLGCIRKHHTVTNNAEITVECNPSTVDLDFFKKISDAGVNRVSLGLQSAVDCERRALGRTADRQKVETAVNHAKKAGIDNISLDVMLGIPMQTPETLNETLDFCIASEIQHISVYMLSIEEGTVFYKRQNTLSLPDEETVCDMYLSMCEKLEEKGFGHYEISNFALPGYESRHNLKYWRCEEYLGIGASAHSFLNGKRFYFERSISSFINSEKAVYDSDGGSAEEYIMLRLRLKEGLDLSQLNDRFGNDISSDITRKAEKFISSGHIKKAGDRIGLTNKGMLISNYIISEMI